MRAAFAALNDTLVAQGGRLDSIEGRMEAGFVKVDHWFELQQQQFVDWRTRLQKQIDELCGRVDALASQVTLLRDHFTREIAGIRVELRTIGAQCEQVPELRREVAELSVRVDRIDQRQSD